jgi:hypothetical protein
VKQGKLIEYSEYQDLVLDTSKDVLSPHHLIQILGLVLTLPVVPGYK